jgi:hypothetical protein
MDDVSRKEAAEKKERELAPREFESGVNGRNTSESLDEETSKRQARS